jgi:hypothetical protein
LPRKGLEREILLPLHIPVGTDLITRELLFEEGDALVLDDCFSTARQIWKTGLFSHVRLRADSIDEMTTDIKLELRDRLSAAPYLALQSGGGVAGVGAGVDAVNIGGVRVALDAALRYRTVNSIGWEGTLMLTQDRLWFDSELRGTLRLASNRLRSEQSLRVEVPLDRTSEWFAGGFHLFHAAGNDVVYRSVTGATVAATSAGTSFLLADASNARTTPFASGGAEAYFTMFGRYWEQDFSMTLLAGWQGAARESATFRRPLDNAAYFLGSLLLPITDEESIKYSHGLWEREMETLPPAQRSLYVPGFVGRSTIGMNVLSGADSLARGVRSQGAFGVTLGGGGFLQSGTYLFALAGLHLIGWERPSPLIWGNGEIQFKMALPLVQSSLQADSTASVPPPLLTVQASLLGAGRTGQTGFSQIIVDNERFLRGYAANAFVGDGRWSWQMEVRNLPIAQVGRYALTGTLFWDIAGAWGAATTFNIGRSLAQSGGQSFGAGLRLRYPSLTGGLGLLRLDLAYNTSAGRLGQIILSTQEAFSLFGAMERAGSPEIWSERRFVEQ